MTTEHLRDRLDRLKSRWTWIPLALMVLGVCWWIVGVWGNVDFLLGKWDDFRTSPVGIAVLRWLFSPGGLFVLGVVWLTFLLLRGAPVEQRLYATKRLLAEAEDEFRLAATRPRPKSLEQATSGAHTTLSVMQFLSQAFSHHIRTDFDTYLSVEGDKWRDAGVPHNADSSIADYLRRLRLKAADQDLDFGFYLPQTYSQYREADKWPQNKRPIPTNEKPESAVGPTTPALDGLLRALRIVNTLLVSPFFPFAGHGIERRARSKRHQDLADALTEKHAEAIHEFVNKLPTSVADTDLWLLNTGTWTDEVVEIMKQFQCTKQETNHVQTISQFDLLPYGNVPSHVALFLVRVQRVVDIATQHANAAKTHGS